jgi:hypothetical protein
MGHGEEEERESRRFEIYIGKYIEWKASTKVSPIVLEGQNI